MLALGRSSSQNQQHKNGDGGVDVDPQQSLEWIFDTVPALAKLTHAERAIVLDRGVGGPDVSDAASSIVDARLVLEQGVQSGRRDDLVALKGLFEWVEWRARRSQKDQGQGNGNGEGGGGGGKDEAVGVLTKIDWNGEGWLRESVVEGLKGSLWLASRE